MKFKPLPVGVDNFEKMISEHYFYVDKTLLIKDIIDTKGEVTLCTRPRRFGKSLNISMLQYFFDKNKKKYAHIFDGLNITKIGGVYLTHQNSYPVIKITLKSADMGNFEDSFKQLKMEISEEFQRHNYLLKSESLSEQQKAFFIRIINLEADIAVYARSLKFLSSCLELHHNKKVFILIDEYDVPLEKAYFQGYYEDMVNFIRGFFSNTLKTNDSLYKAILTGCLRISKESIFTGVNNLKIVSILTNNFDEYFGFAEKEVVDALKYYGFGEKAKEAKEWYNGYLFGKSVVYNPWSIIQYLDGLCHKETRPKSFWANTSSNSIIKELVQNADNDTKGEIESLMAGGTICKPIKEDIVYAEIMDTMDNLWSFLFFTGYLKKVSERMDGVRTLIEMKIPNNEIAYIYDRFIYEWFQQRVKVNNYSVLYMAVIDGNAALFQKELSDILIKTISFMDSAESFYHGFLLGVLRPMEGYLIKSNREVGVGRSDIFIKPLTIRKRAIIIELKKAKTATELYGMAKEGLQQIYDKKYDIELLEEGYVDILRYGIAFYRKDCEIVVG